MKCPRGTVDGTERGDRGGFLRAFCSVNRMHVASLGVLACAYRRQQRVGGCVEGFCLAVGEGDAVCLQQMCFRLGGAHGRAISRVPHRLMEIPALPAAAYHWPPLGFRHPHGGVTVHGLVRLPPRISPKGQQPRRGRGPLPGSWPSPPLVSRMLGAPSFTAAVRY
jgi:hypothetical protein